MAGTDDDSSRGLPLDSPLWLASEETHRRLCQLTSNRDLAARDLTAAHAAGAVRTMRRWHLRHFRRGGWPDRRPCDHRLWLVWFEFSSWPDGLRVVYRLHGAARHRPHQVRRLRGYTFYAWLPDLAEVWPSIFAPMLPPATPTPVAAVEGQGTVSMIGIAEAAPPQPSSVLHELASIVPLSEFTPHGSQLSAVSRFALQIYGETLPDHVTAADLDHAIIEHLTAEAKARGKPVDKYPPFKRRPSRDSCGRFIEGWKEFCRRRTPDA